MSVFQLDRVRGKATELRYHSEQERFLPLMVTCRLAYSGGEAIRLACSIDEVPNPHHDEKYQQRRIASS